MPKEIRWHKLVKEALKEIGKKRGYDVSESEKEMILADKFKMVKFAVGISGSQKYDYDVKKRETHTFSYKPDGVWKKGHIYRAIFEVEHLKIRNGSRITAKRKYSIGSFMLAYLAMFQKSASHIVFITDNLNLYREIVTFKQLIPLEHRKYTHTLFLRASNHPSIKRGLEETLINKWKI